MTMTQYYITLNEEDLHHLFSGNDESLKKVVEQFTNQLLEQQRTEQINAEPYERTDERKGMRNGYKERHLTTRVGTLTLRVPQIRDGIFTTDIFECYQRSEKALIATLMEMVVNGVSTRKVARITEELCGTHARHRPYRSFVKILMFHLNPGGIGIYPRPLTPF